MAYCLCRIDVGANGLREKDDIRSPEVRCVKVRRPVTLPVRRQGSQIHPFEPWAAGKDLREMIFSIEMMTSCSPNGLWLVYCVPGEVKT